MLHVLVGQVCNNNCLFCMEVDRDGRGQHIASQSRDDIRRMIFTYPNDDEILFTSGEPTLSPDLPTYISWAKQRGFAIIGLITNGRRLAYPSFVDHLVSRGLNRITISIHGHTAKLHDGLTRAPGSFSQTHEGLANCARVKRHQDLRVHTSTVLTRRNLPHVQAIHGMLASLDVDQIVWNVMMAKGRGALHFESLMPPYGQVVSSLTALCDTLDAEAIRRIRVVDMPPCILQKLPHDLGGDLEEFDQYEPIGSTGVSGFEVLNPASSSSPRDVAHPIRGRARSLSKAHERGGLSHIVERGSQHVSSMLTRLRAKPSPSVRLQAFSSDDAVAQERNTMHAVRRIVSEPKLEDAHAYYVTHRAFKDQFLRTKGPPCKRCSVRNTCPGVWELYAERYGWNEFRPIEDPVRSK